MIKLGKAPKHILNTNALIKRWRVEGKRVPRSFSLLGHDTGCSKKLYRVGPEEWLESAEIVFQVQAT